MLLAPVLLASLLSPPAAAEVTDARPTVRADNVLRYDFRIQTTEHAQVAVKFWPAGTLAAGASTTAYSALGLRHSVPVWGLKPSTTYNYQVLVTDPDGTTYTYAPRRQFTTAALPTDIPGMTAVTVTGAPDFTYMMFDTRATDDSQGILIVTDATGAVRWYQYAPSSTDTFSAVYYDEAEAEVWAIVNYDRLVRYDMNGSILTDWQLGGVLADYIHHEVTVHDGVVYVITARISTWDGVDYIEDGIEGYTPDGTLVYEWWAGDDGGLTVADNAPFYWYPTGSGPWGDTFPTGKDWLHANSLQVLDTAGGTKLYLGLRHTSQIAKIDAATGAIDWLMGQNDTGSTDALGDFTISPLGVTTDWWEVQHHAHFEAADGKLYLFDNGDGRLSRMLAAQVNEVSRTIKIDRAADVDDFRTFRFNGNCHSEGSTFRTEHNHLLIACGTEEFIADYDASNQLTWYLDVNTREHVYRGTPMSWLGY